MKVKEKDIKCVWYPISCPYCSQLQWHSDEYLPGILSDSCRCHACGRVFLFNYDTVNYRHCVDGRSIPVGVEGIDWVRCGRIGDCYCGISFKECAEHLAMSAAIKGLCSCKSKEDLDEWLEI